LATDLIGPAVAAKLFSNRKSNLPPSKEGGREIAILRYRRCLVAEGTFGKASAFCLPLFGSGSTGLGNRNLLQVKNDPNYKLNGKDIFRQYLGDHPANFSFTTIALPMEREIDCPDCAHLHPEVDSQKSQNDIQDNRIN